MKIYIRNMVCQGTGIFVLRELEKLGYKYNILESGELYFKKDLSLSEIKKLSHSLRKYGLVLALDKNKPVRKTINDTQHEKRNIHKLSFKPS
jgi:hypothetical protein